MDRLTNDVPLNSSLSQLNLGDDLHDRKNNKVSVTPPSSPPKDGDVSASTSAIFAGASAQITAPSAMIARSVEPSVVKMTHPLSVMSCAKEMFELAAENTSGYEAGTFEVLGNHKYDKNVQDFLNLPPRFVDFNETISALYDYASSSTTGCDGMKCTVDGKPFALFVRDKISEPDEYKIIFFVAAPWAVDVEGPLFETAVNHSVELGFGGVISLDYLDHHGRVDRYLENAFEKFGFEGSSKMILDPTKSDLWTKNDSGQYQYSSQVSDVTSSANAQSSNLTSISGLKSMDTAVSSFEVYANLYGNLPINKPHASVEGPISTVYLESSEEVSADLTNLLHQITDKIPRYNETAFFKLRSFFPTKQIEQMLDLPDDFLATIEEIQGKLFFLEDDDSEGIKIMSGNELSSVVIIEKEDNRFLISEIITDPTMLNVKAPIIEAAVNLSVEQGFGGVIEYTCDIDTMAPYVDLGFEGHYPIILDPATSNLWAQRGDGEYYYNPPGD